MSASAPERASAARTPPWPSGERKTRSGASRTTRPSGLSAGHIPCEKKNTSSAGRPKLPFSAKKARVAASFVLLVIT